jgi:hypothetical protein
MLLAQAIGAFHSRTIENKMAAAKHTKAMRCGTMHPFYKLSSSENSAFCCRQSSEGQQHPHALPTKACRASHAISGVTARAATGSAQAIPKSWWVASPARVTSER